ncbi:hypothetical protein ACLB2K_006066 [Fragaria x ananassa]
MPTAGMQEPLLTATDFFLQVITASSVTVLALAPKKKRDLCSGKNSEDIVTQTEQKIKMKYCPSVKGPSVRGINSLVTHDIGSAIQSLVGMRARTFYDLDQEEKWKVWNAMSRLSLANKRNRGEKTMHHHTGSSLIIYTMEKLRIQGEQLPIIKGFEKTYVRAGDEDMTKKHVNCSSCTSLSAIKNS